jgi:hypothetical protein
MVSSVCQPRLELMTQEELFNQACIAYLRDMGPLTTDQLMPYVSWASQTYVRATLLSMHLAGAVHIAGWQEGEPIWTLAE